VKVWIVEIGESIPGIDGNAREWRCGMLSSALIASGHQVSWWASTFYHAQKQHRFDGPRNIQVQPSLEIRLLHGPGYGRNRSLKRFLHHRLLAEAFTRDAKMAIRPDVVFCCLPTLELADQAVKYGQKTGVPVIVDIRDLWPDHYLTLVPPQFVRVLKLALVSEYHRARRLLEGANGITAISQAFLNWGLKNAGRSVRETDGIFPMGYPADTASQDQIDARRTALATQYGFRPDELIVTFVGTFVSSFDFQTVLTVARTLEQTGRLHVRFVLVGDGDNRQLLREFAQGLSSVVFTGWFDQTSIRAMLSLSSVGLAPYRDDASMSLPNKPFEYMSAGLPLLSSLRGELEDLIRGAQIGLQYEAGDAASLVERIRWLAANPKAREAMGQRARRLFESTYSAEVIYPKLVRHLEQVVRAGGQQ
jgi:glycosyltransferase involved in cell wall biosynthesis